MQQRYEYLVNPQIAKIASNKEYIHYFSYGDHLNHYSRASPSKSEISFNVVKDFPHPVGLSQKFHFTTGSDGTDEIYYERPLGLGITAKLHIKNLLRNSEITINNSYYRFIRARLDNLYPPGVHLTDILTVNLLKTGYTPVHCAAISSDGEGILLPAPPDTGKSLTSILASRHGFHFLSEDIAIADEDFVYANPQTSTFFYHINEFENSKSMKSIFFNSFYKIPFLPYYLTRPAASISKIMKNFKVDEKARIKKILILDKGNTAFEKISSEEALRRILILNRNEFSYHKNSILFAYSYFNPSFDLPRFMNAEERILRTLVNKTECFILKANDPKEYINLLMAVSK
jgi:hypothetical protein